MKNSCFCQLEAELRKGFIFSLCWKDGNFSNKTESCFAWSPLQKAQCMFVQLPALGGSGRIGLHRKPSV